MTPALCVATLADQWDLKQIADALTAVRTDMLDAERRFADHWQRLPVSRRESARNLLHYVAMRQRDIRALQTQLAARGLSSLGRAESGVLSSLDTVASVVRRLQGEDAVAAAVESGIQIGRGREVLDAHTRELLGSDPRGRNVRIMVTMPPEAAHDYQLVRGLLASGMDDEAAWERMLGYLDRARRELDRPCRVLVDIAGPKLRTGPVEARALVLRWKPVRDDYGRVVEAVRIWLTPRENPSLPPLPAAAVLPIAADWLAALAANDIVKFFDARDSMREMRIVSRLEVACGRSPAKPRIWCRGQRFISRARRSRAARRLATSSRRLEHFAWLRATRSS